MEQTNNNFGQYLKDVNERYNPDGKQSLTEILDSFRQIPKDYTEFIKNKSQEFNYSSYEFLKCSKEEQDNFINEELQLVECLVQNAIWEKTGITWNWANIYKLLLDPQYSLTEKSKRKVVYPTSMSNRPIGDPAFQMWNGLQIIDLDIKNAELTNNLKPLIFEDLKKYNWFLGICKSASGKGLHIWTKITPISVEFKNRKVEYLCNFRHKYSYVYIVLSKYMNRFGYKTENIYSFIDMAMAKPQQGIFISSDSTAMLNTNFKDLRLDVNFESAFNTGIESIDWISHPDLKNIFSKLEWFNNDTFDKTNNVDVSNIENIEERDYNRAHGRKHYKHNQRWQLANTLTNIFGEDKALNIMIEICSGTDKRELKGDVRTASIHNKPISMWAINELNKYHGFSLKVKQDEFDENISNIEKDANEAVEKGEDPLHVLNDRTKLIKLYISKDQYLGSIKDDILKNLSHITLLEAGAGYGKTEMVKAFGGKTLLILPFTSTIKAKVEASETTKDWLYYYGNKKPTLDELLGDRSMSMTIDKFSHLNVMELDQANFEYIVIDESHLLFTSSYREVMAPCIQRLANCKAKVIMMTGTPTGETLFFPNITHIKVKKEDVRIKEFQINYCNKPIDQYIEMCQSMADEIMKGHKVFYPTNKGNLHYEQVTGNIQEILNEHNFGRQLKRFYYKKSNFGEASMDGINIDKTIGSNDIIFCTTYLSVGVDICDRFTFSVYFDELWMAQDIEQFANRLRNNNLYIKLFIPTQDNDGVLIDYNYVQRLNLGISQNELLLARDMVRTCNDMLERNKEESKYSPFIQGFLSSSKYLKYDENDCKYYIDETTYKLSLFEERYSDYAKQLPVLKNNIKYYGYEIKEEYHSNAIPTEQVEYVELRLRQLKQSRYSYVKEQTQKLIHSINDGNIDIYRELIKGNYEIFKGDKHKDIRELNQLWTDDIEIMEKNLPIILSLYRYYDCQTISDIYTYCTDNRQDKINFSKLGRIRKFVSIEYNRKKDKLDFPVIRFIKDCKDWANEHNITTKQEIQVFLGNYAAKYANSISGVVVQDIDFFEKVWDLVNELWKVIIIQQRPQNGSIIIKPFELLWETKFDLQNIYGNVNTKEFFINELVDGMTEEDFGSYEPDEAEMPDLEMTEKKTLDDVQLELPSVIHSSFEYDKYSTEDGSNDRFMRKQENTNSLRDTIFENIEEKEIEEKKELDLFDNCPF